MSDLLERELYNSLINQKNNWYYKYKIYKVKNEIKKFIKHNSLSEKNCLDIGCGNGIISFGVGDKVKGTSLNWKLVDSNFTKDDLKNDSRKSTKIEINKKFDIVIACDVLEHIDNDIQFLELINNCMKKDSILILTVPAMEILWSDHDVFLKHFRRYNRKSLENSVKKNFRLLNIEYTYKSLFPLALIVILIKRITSSILRRKSFKIEETVANTFFLINYLFLTILKIEEIFSKKFKFINSFPGVSLIATLKKSN